MSWVRLTKCTQARQAPSFGHEQSLHQATKSRETTALAGSKRLLPEQTKRSHRHVRDWSVPRRFRHASDMVAPRLGLACASVWVTPARRRTSGNQSPSGGYVTDAGTR